MKQTLLQHPGLVLTASLTLMFLGRALQAAAERGVLGVTLFGFLVTALCIHQILLDATAVQIRALRAVALGIVLGAFFAFLYASLSGTPSGGAPEALAAAGGLLATWLEWERGPKDPPAYT